MSAQLDTSRVKLYVTDADSNWIECGEGNLIIHSSTDQDSAGQFIKVIASQQLSRIVDQARLRRLRNGMGRDCLLYTQIDKNNAYERQSETIIIWIDKNLEEEIALSFSEQTFANSLWNLICHVTGRHSNSNQLSPLAIIFNPQQIQSVELPDQSNLLAFLERLKNQSELMCAALVIRSKQFIQRLTDIFNRATQQNRQATLQSLALIVLQILSLNDAQLLVELLKESNFLFTLGCLEWSPLKSTVRRPHKQELLKSRWLWPVQLQLSQELSQKIGMLHKLNYLKDTFLLQLISQENLITFILYKRYQEVLALLVRDKKIRQAVRLVDSQPLVVPFLIQIIYVIKHYFLASPEDIKSKVLSQLDYGQLFHAIAPQLPLFPGERLASSLQLVSLLLLYDPERVTPPLLKSQLIHSLSRLTLETQSTLAVQSMGIVRQLLAQNKVIQTRIRQIDINLSLLQNYLAPITRKLSIQTGSVVLIELANLIREFMINCYEPTAVLLCSTALFLRLQTIARGDRGQRLFILKLIKSLLFDKDTQLNSFIINYKLLQLALQTGKISGLAFNCLCDILALINKFNLRSFINNFIVLQRTNTWPALRKIPVLEKFVAEAMKSISKQRIGQESDEEEEVELKRERKDSVEILAKGELRKLTKQ